MSTFMPSLPSSGRSKFLQLLAEGLFTGVALIASVYVVSHILKMLVPTLKPSLPEICSTWNENYVMEITLVGAAIALHLVFEYTGINAAYKAGRTLPGF